MSRLLLLDRVSMTFGASRIVEEASLVVESGDFVGLAGPSGGGKSTLLRLMGGLLKPSSGRMERYTNRVGMVFQEPHLLPWRTARENISIFVRADGVTSSDAEGVAMDWLGRTGLIDSAGRYPSEMSGGMRQRLELARALAMRPQLLLLDEPFSAQELGRRGELKELVRDWALEHGAGLVLVSHYPEEIADCCDRRFELKNGRLREV